MRITRLWSTTNIKHPDLSVDNLGAKKLALLNSEHILFGEMGVFI